MYHYILKPFRSSIFGASKVKLALLVALSWWGVPAQAQMIFVHSLAELRDAVTLSNQNIVMQAGDYDLEDALDPDSRNIICSGSNNTIELSGVYVKVPVGSVSTTYVYITGDNNTWIGGEFEDVYRNGLTEITDFSAYNQDRTNLAKGLGGAAVMDVTGSDNIVEGIKLTVRGSFPYGYGSIYGIGAGNTFGLDKRCGLLVTGNNNILNNVEIQQRAFGHGIFMQSGADNTLVKNCLVEGILRPTADFYNDSNSYDLPFRSDYLRPQEDNSPIPMDEMSTLCEDGIRMYNNTGSVTVENCTVKKMRGGIRTYLGGESSVSNSTALDCHNTNYNMSSGGEITNSSGNFAYGPLSDFRLGRSNMNIEWTIIPSPHATGSHNLCDVLGNNHSIVFNYPENTPIEETDRAIVISGNNSTIINKTHYSVVLEASATGNTITSLGSVTDNGTGNTICEGGVDPFSTIEVENICDQFGIEFEDTTDEGGGQNATLINNGDWIEYGLVDFARGAVSVDARVSSDSSGGSLELWLGSTTGRLIGTLAIPGTGGAQNWVTISSALDEEVEGFQNLFFKAVGGSGDLFNLNWLSFEKSDDAVNLAFGGTATQSSTENDGAAERAIDGNVSGDWADNSVTHTASETNPWLEVDLGSVQNIGDIILYPRTDCCSERLTFFTVSVLDASRNEVYSRSYTRSVLDSLAVDTRGVDGQFVRVELDEENVLSLAELEIYSYLDVDSDGDGDFDSVDTDDDNDGYLDGVDTFAVNPNEWSDVDGDGIGGNFDIDRDDDGYLNSNDAFPLNALEWRDVDGDGVGDNADEDDDGDGVGDVDDLFPLNPREWTDTDGDGIADNSEIAGDFVNISTRAYVQNGSGVVIGGFVIEGTEPVLVLVQGIGGELIMYPYGMKGVLLDTTVSIYQGNEEIAFNDDWDSDSNIASELLDAGVVTGALTLLKGSKSGAILTELDPGVYTILLRGKEEASGIVLVEAYKVNLDD